MDGVSVMDQTESVIDGERISAPPDCLKFGEMFRAPVELAAFYLTLPLLTHGRHGDGHPVLTLPGMLADDRSTEPMRQVMRARGLDPHAWGLGQNLGPTREIMSGLPRLVRQLHRSSGQRVSLVGWSLGGILAREIARSLPEHVRQVITLGSPFRLRSSDPAQLSSVGQAFQRLRPLHTTSFDRLPRESDRAPLQCAQTSIFSRSDGVVPWRACMADHGPRAENIEVMASHCGLGVDPWTLQILMNRLTQSEESWRPYGQRAAA